MRARVLVAIVLAALVAFAFVSRLTGLDKLQPHLDEADPGLVVQVKLLREGIAPDPVAHKAYLAYPTLMMRGLALIPEPRVAASAPLDEQLAAASSDFVRVRTLIALLSALLVPLTWWLARKFLGEVGALTAAAFVALSLLHLLYSQQARPHGAHATVALAAVLAHLALLKRPSVARLALSSLACAVAIGCLHTGVFTLPPLAVAWWLARRDGKRLPWWSAAAALVPCALAAWFLYARAPRLEDEGETLEFGGHTLHFDKLDGSGFRTFVEAWWNYDPVLFAVAAIGGLLALAVWLRALRAKREHGAQMLVVLGYALPYTLALGVFGETVDRFLLPVLPYLALLAGFAVERVRPHAIRIVLACAVLAFPAFMVSRYIAVREAPDTFERAAEWVRQNTKPRGEHMLLSLRMTLPLFHDDAALAFVERDGTTSKRPWIRYQLDRRGEAQDASRESYALFIAPTKLRNQLPPESTETIERLLDEVRPTYAILEASKLMNVTLPGPRALREIVAARGELVDVIRGEDADACLRQPLDYQEIPDIVPRLLHATAFGPCVEIYRLQRR